MTMLKRMSLRTKLMIVSVMLVLVPVTVIGIHALNKISASINSLTGNTMTMYAKQLAAGMQVTLQSELRSIAGIATARRIIGGATGNIDAAEDALKDVMKKVGSNYEAAYVTDANGVIQADGVGGTYRGINVADRDYFQSAKNGKSIIGTPVKSKKTGKPIAVAATPLYGDNGNFVGTLCAALNVEMICQTINETKIGNTGYAFMFDGEGMTVAHPKKEFVLELNGKTIQGMESLIKVMLEQKTGIESYAFKGVDKLAGYAPVPLTGWSIGITQDRNDFMAIAETIRNSIIITTVIMLAIAIGIAWFFSRSITKPIIKITTLLNEGYNQIVSAADQVSSSSQGLAEGTSQQAAAIEETSASMEQMAAQTKQNAGNTAQANSLVIETGSVVEKANRSMNNLMASMAEITLASTETSKIIKTIDEIAFQTNLLALNAAVEAARAGNAGAGFAVVAAEVRNLALRSAEAAKNTSDMIETTLKKVNAGHTIVSETNAAFTDVAIRSERVSQLIGEISEASKEQSLGISQVTKAIEEMDKVVQQNAATAEESASASEELHAQAESMRSFIQDLSAVIGV